MCSAPKIPKVETPVQYAAMKMPTYAATKDASQRTEDQVRAAAPTVLGGASTFGTSSTTKGKTLLGQ